MSTPRTELEPTERRARARRLAIVLGLIAFGFYAGFILLGLVGGGR
jgi:hypothetical protein